MTHPPERSLAEMAKVKPKRKEVKPGKPAKPLNGETLHAAVTWAVGRQAFAGLKAHGNTAWAASELVVLAVLWVWSDQKTLTGAFQEANRWTVDVLGRSVLGTYQGLAGALTTWTARLLPILRGHLHRLMERDGAAHFRIGGWVPLAVDGTRVGVPRTRENETAFSSSTYGRSATARYRRKRRRRAGVRARRGRDKATPQGPQVWLTLLWHMGLQMPWDWRTGPSTASERGHFRDLVADRAYPEGTLFCGDAGFSGYDLWRAVLDRKQHFLIRVGANVTLLTGLGFVREADGIVSLWPTQAAKRRLPPLVLRRIDVRVGKARVTLVTSVLSARRLSPALARRLYRLRWGVELQFRTLKQTFGRRMLRSRTPDRALVELDWSFVGLWLIQLFAVKEQIDLGQLPEQCSAGLAINIVREAFDRWWERPKRGAGMASRLGKAVKDEYVRTTSKRGRYQPQTKSKPSCGHPTIRKATREHKAWLRKYLATAA
jgi:hypothetical protein